MTTALLIVGFALIIAGGITWSVPAALIIGGLVVAAVAIGLDRAGVGA